jgi:hypothetical protein
MRKIADSYTAGHVKCQIHDIQNISEYPGRIERWLLLAKRIKRFTKRRFNYLLNAFNGLISRDQAGREIDSISPLAVTLQAGNLVRVKSRQEIERSLNNWNQIKGCSFMEEMWQYCGSTQRILKKVEKFLDERDYLIKKCKGVYLLEGVLCSGTSDFGRCDRSCFFFWREEWLEKIQ